MARLHQVHAAARARTLEWGSLATTKSISANYPSSIPNRRLNQGSVSLFITEL
jgi:hypothetical protein